MFWLRNEKIVFNYALLSGGLPVSVVTKSHELVK